MTSDTGIAILHDAERTPCLPLTAEGLALELAGALDPSPPFLLPLLSRLTAGLRGRLATLHLA